MGYAFISYSTKNQQMADSFKTLFNQNGIETWMAPGDMPFGSTYTSTINRAIKGASCFVLLLSENAQGSQWVLKETERAVSTGKTIFTVKLDDVPLNDDFEFMISTSHAVAIRKIDKNDDNIKRLLQSVITYTEKTYTAKGDNTHEDKSFCIHNGKIVINNRYELQNLIGEGGFGATYKAKDLKDKKNVAIKISKCNSPQIIRLHQFLAKKTSDYLCKIYDAEITSDGESYIVMEWVEKGNSLSTVKDYKEFYESFNEDYVFGVHISILIDVLKGLKHLHSIGIVHADINPSNILTDGFSAKLIDYSSSFFIEDGYSYDDHTWIVGEYNSPEYGSKRDFRSDLYSAAMVAFKWLTGNIPKMDCNGHLSYENANLDNELMIILKKATAFNPEDRYQYADHFIKALELYRLNLLERYHKKD